ncbi:MAG: hypothetical protein IKM55_00155 [Bacilli bacterium]|nr:hypothetical protein [Bacilli bacterium]
MLNRNPETYNEIVHLKKMLDLAKYYQLSAEVMDEVSDFILADPKNTVVCDASRMVLKSNGTEQKTFAVAKMSSAIDGLTLSAASLVVVPHYTPSSGGGGYSGGGSSNNNNNNNNN